MPQLNSIRKSIPSANARSPPVLYAALRWFSHIVLQWRSGSALFVGYMMAQNSSECSNIVSVFIDLFVTQSWRWAHKQLMWCIMLV